MIKSFRLRLALLSALLSGFALVAFGIGTMLLIRNIKIERIDNEVRTYAEREVARARNDPDWQRTEARLASVMGIRDGKDMLLLVQDGNGDALYRSAHWPAAFDAERLPWPEQSDTTGVGASLSWVAEARAETLDAPMLLAQAGPGFGHPPPGWRFRRDGPPPRPEGLQNDGANRDRPQPPDGDFRPRQDAPQTPPPAPTGTALSQGTPPQNAGDRPAEPGNMPPPATDSANGAGGTQLQNPPPRPELQPPAPPPVSVAVSRTIDGQVWRIGLARANNVRVAVAVNAQVIDADMKGIRNAFLVALPISLGLIGFGGWVFSGSALRPLNKLTATTRRVTAEGLNQRISAQGEDNEFAELIEVYNRMLERLERSFKQAHRFSADAAHELKTPLAILQGQLERAINNAEDGSPIQAELTGILDEVRRLSTISRKLLLLSQADAGRLNVHREPFDLSKALDDLVEDTRMLAPQLQVSGEIQPGLSVNADGGLLRQVLHNLISNAIKYNVENGWIKISTSMRPQWIDVQVANASTGIPAAERTRIFERFYRADPAHSRQVEGVGLGLSVSREIARAHGGDITLKVGKDDAVEFVLSLPYLAPK